MVGGLDGWSVDNQLICCFHNSLFLCVIGNGWLTDRILIVLTLFKFLYVHTYTFKLKPQKLVS